VKKTEHLKRRVFLGYLSMLAMAIIAIIHISGLISRIIEEEKRDDLAGEKSTIITKILLLLYESETYTQFIRAEEEDLTLFHSALDKVSEQLQLLRSYASDSSQQEKINHLEALLKQKRENTQLLQHTWWEIEHLYSKHFAGEIQRKNNLARELEIQSQEKIQKDTLLMQRQNKGFFKRLAEAFVPVKADSAIRTNVSRQSQTDSLVHVYNPADTISSVLRKIQSNIDIEHARLHAELTQRVDELRRNSHVTGVRINQILFEIEEEQQISAYEQEQIKDRVVRNTSKHLAVIALISVLVTLIFLFLIFRDISRSRYYRKQLENAKQFAEDLLRSREKFMLMISHDIRAPLSSIQGYIELMKSHPTENRQEYVENISILSQHILVLVNDLLEFHRLESGKITMRPVPFRATVLFEEIYIGFKPQAHDKGLNFFLNITALQESWVYIGDPVRIRQAVGNLLSNAIKFTPKGHEVSLTVSALSQPDGPQGLRIAVKDNGRGIAEAEQDLIFKEFTRLTGSEHVDGFGLGLAITGKLIEQMGGTISLNSKEGEGSEFVVQLPLPLSDEASVAGETPGERFVPFRNINCLAIDDDVLQLKLTEEMLKRNHVNVITLSDSGEVAELLQIASFDIILTDIQMPGLDGYALLRQIRSSGIEGAESIPVIALSAQLSEEDAHYIEAGFTGFLSKPFTVAQLLSLFSRLFPEFEPSAVLPDTSALTAFAGDDKEAARAILRTFSEETRKSIVLLGEALESGDRALVAKISHKLIPVLTLMEAYLPVQQLRILETNAVSQTEEEWRQIVQEVMEQITRVVENIRVE
jgi:signal transduction histidine kinase/CheY-like chemotaxis protein